MSNTLDIAALLNGAALTPELLLQLAVKLNGAEAVAKAAKQAKTEAPTMLSVTMDAIAAAALAGAVITKDVADKATVNARAAGLLKPDEEATHSSVAQLIRHASAYDAAMTRAGYEWSKRETVSSEPSEPATAPEAAPASDDNVPPLPAPAASAEVRKRNGAAPASASMAA